MNIESGCNPLKFIYRALSMGCILLAVTVTGGFAQSVLSPGDIAVVTVNTGENSGFEFVTLKDLEPGTEIYFTDNAYLAHDDAIDGREGQIRYRAEGPVPQGSVISYTGEEEGPFERSGRFNLSATGDNLLVYQSDREVTYIYAVGWTEKGAEWKYDEPVSEFRSDIPPGLDENRNTLLSLNGAPYYRYDPGNGNSGSPSYILDLIGDTGNWQKRKESAFSAGDLSFEPGERPTVQFSSLTMNVREGGRILLPIEITRKVKGPVEVTVTFSEEESSSGTGDIGNFRSGTIYFDENDPAGSTKYISIQVEDDRIFEEQEVAVFQLQYRMAESMQEAAAAKIQIMDNDSPELVITEVLADPGERDVNGDGRVRRSEDSFVEIKNNESEEIDLSSWKLLNSREEGYVFPQGTFIPSGGAMIVFTGGEPEGNFGGAALEIADNLSLDNDRETLSLVDDMGNIVSTFSYGGAGEISVRSGESMSRYPRASAPVMAHSESNSDQATLFSPGKKMDGTPYGAEFAVAVRGTEGWRMMGTPSANTTFEDLFERFWMQGLPGSDAPGDKPTIMAWEERGGGAFVAPSSMSGRSGLMEPGRGYLVYFYEDDIRNEPGVQGAFPKVISTDKKGNSTVSIPVSSSDADGNRLIDRQEGWNLLSNPFGTAISVKKVIEALEKVHPAVQHNVLVWDPGSGGGNGAFVTLRGEDLIDPFEAFWVRFTEGGVDGVATFDRIEMVERQSADLLTEINDNFSLQLTLDDGTNRDTFHMAFRNEGKPDLDKNDAFKLFSLNPGSINLYGVLGGQKLMENVLPNELDANIEIPLALSAPASEMLKLTWEGLDGLPKDWEVRIRDRETDKEIDLRTVSEYEFNPRGDDRFKSIESTSPPELNTTTATNSEARFILGIYPSELTNAGMTDLPESVKLNPNYPNPFNPSTTISYELKEEAKVLLSVWNIVGQRVATLVDKTMEAGEHTASWNASNMPSGIYIAQLEVGDQVFIRKMTLIK